MKNNLKELREKIEKEVKGLSDILFIKSAWENEKEIINSTNIQSSVSTLISFKEEKAKLELLNQVEEIIKKWKEDFVKKIKDIPLTSKQLAEEFHRTYENFAEYNNWKTQRKCRVKFDDLPEKNKETMIDTCQHILLWIEANLVERRNKLAKEFKEKLK